MLEHSRSVLQIAKHNPILAPAFNGPSLELSQVVRRQLQSGSYLHIPYTPVSFTLPFRGIKVTLP